MSRIVVIGAGAWGTALAIQAARAGNRVTLWARDPGRAAALSATRENPRLPGVKLPDAIEVTDALPPSPLEGEGWGGGVPADLPPPDPSPQPSPTRGEGVDPIRAILLAVPMQHLRGVLARLPASPAPLVVCAKGVETGTHLLP